MLPRSTWPRKSGGELLHFGEKEDNEMPPHFFQKEKLREAVYFSARFSAANDANDILKKLTFKKNFDI